MPRATTAGPSVNGYLTPHSDTNLCRPIEVPVATRPRPKCRRNDLEPAASYTWRSCNCELPGCAPIAKKFTKTNSVLSAVRRRLLSSRDGYRLRNGALAVDLHQSRQSSPRSRPSDAGSRSEPSDLLPSQSGGGSCRPARRRLKPQRRPTAVPVARKCLLKTRRSPPRSGDAKSSKTLGTVQPFRPTLGKLPLRAPAVTFWLDV